MASNSLDKIINKKIEKLNLLKNKFKIEDLVQKIEKFDKYLDFKKKINSNFSKGKFSIIAEIKKTSPSAGVIIENYNPVNIAKIYEKNKATCLSILTEEDFFNGSLEHISKYNLRIIDEINYFIVESEKKSRRFIKKILPTKNQDDLTFFQIKKNKNVINNENYLNPLIKGQNMGLMSDSGNPVIADPGASIINTAHILKINVKPLVGPSSILLALISSGMKGQRFTFNGYLPINSKERIKKLKFLEKKSKKNDETQIFIETPYRNNQLLDLTKRVLSQDTQLSVASCLDSKEEKIISLSISEWKKEEVDLNKKPTVFLIDAK